MITILWLVAALPTAFSADVTFPAELHASSSSAASPQLMTLGKVAFGNGYTFDTRGWNGGLPGPTLRMKPGETFYVTLKNELDPANDKTCTQTGTEYCETATTNFHTHGLHISSKGMSDGLAYYSDDVFARVEPGASASFQFAIPDNHMGGTHWYHPHVHHATALQAGGGAAGIFIVEDPVGYLPSAYSSMIEKVLFISGHNLVTLQSMAVDSQSTLMQTAATDAQTAMKDTNLFLVNGQIGPTMAIASHVWHRLRIAYAAVEQSLQLVVAGGTATCQTQLLAKDGVYLTSIPRAVTTIYLYPGARADVALSCTCPSYPCDIELQSSSVAGQPGGPGGPPPGGGGRGGGRRMQGGRPRPPPPQGMGQGGAAPGAPAADAVNVTVMQIVVTETSGGTTTTLPTTQLQRPCYLVDLRSATPADSGTLALNGGARRVQWNGVGNSMTYAAIHNNGNTLTDWPAVATFTAGTIQEMVVTGANAHPLHLHINPYQIISMPQNSIGDGYFQVGDWHDTLLVEGANTITVRMNVDTFTGKLVVHCHILQHEDEGMMGWINVVGTEGAKYANNKVLDPTCYDSAQEMNTSFTTGGTTGGTTGNTTGGTTGATTGTTGGTGATTGNTTGGTTGNTTGGTTGTTGGTGGTTSGTTGGTTGTTGGTTEAKIQGAATFTVPNPSVILNNATVKAAFELAMEQSIAADVGVSAAACDVKASAGARRLKSAEPRQLAGTIKIDYTITTTSAQSSSVLASVNTAMTVDKITSKTQAAIQGIDAGLCPTCATTTVTDTVITTAPADATTGGTSGATTGGASGGTTATDTTETTTSSLETAGTKRSAAISQHTALILLFLLAPLFFRG